jgi:hypothetical protein
MTMRKKRIFYVSDARHYYLFVFEPPMNIRDAWQAVDEAAGTNVNTFVYMVERGDGLFYPSKVGKRFGSNMKPFDSVAYYRVWHNMQSLIDRGLDPLTVLIDRAHEKGMEFIASLRTTGYLGMDEKHRVPEGRGLLHQEVRDHQFAVLSELANDYETDGIELDLSLAPGGGPFPVREEEAAEGATVITDWIRQISEMVRGRNRGAGAIGVRVYPTEETNIRYGLDVRSWLDAGLVDYVVPSAYIYFNLDTDMPIDWVVEAAHAADVSVYGMLQPYIRDEMTGSAVRIYPTAAQMRAAAANYWDRGVDGLCTWFMKWPLGDTERAILSNLADADLLTEGDKHYVLRERSDTADQLGYGFTLPLDIPKADPNARYTIPLRIADDPSVAGERIRKIVLTITVDNLLSGDKLSILLNGESLAGETCYRSFSWNVAPYTGQVLEFHLKDVLPQKGENQLEISLDERPETMTGGVKVHDVSLSVEYGAYPSKL